MDSYFTGPRQDLSTLPSHLFPPLGMSLSRARESDETLVDYIYDLTGPDDTYNLYSPSVPSPSVTFDIGGQWIGRNALVVESVSNLTMRFTLELGDDQESSLDGRDEIWVLRDIVGQVRRFLCFVSHMPQ